MSVNVPLTYRPLHTFPQAGNIKMSTFLNICVTPLRAPNTTRLGHIFRNIMYI